MNFSCIYSVGSIFCFKGKDLRFGLRAFVQLLFNQGELRSVYAPSFLHLFLNECFSPGA